MKVLFNFLIGIYKKYGTLFQGKFFNTFILFYKYNRISRSLGESLKYAFEAFLKVKVYKQKDKADAINKLLQNVDFDLEGSPRFIYSVDVYRNLKLRGKVLGNCSIDYKKIIDNPLCMAFIESKSDFARRNNHVLDSIYTYLNRLEQAVINSDHPNKNNICRYIKRMSTEKAESFEEALQRILIMNQLQWQTGHILVGLGRLDKVLDRFSDECASEVHLEMLEDFCKLLHKYYFVKSNALMGDTGQIIILGGLNSDGTYFCNSFTKLFIEAVADLQLPDPKVLVRVSQAMPEDGWEFVAGSMCSVAGSPLISNDDQVIKNLIAFGYEEEDAYNYTTSACWEPVAGESFEQNNIVSVNYLEPFNIISKSLNPDSIQSFEQLMDKYYEGLEIHISKLASYLSTIKWEQDPIYSMFCNGCRQNEGDAAFGGSKYNNYGVLTVGLANAVNSLVNIKKLVFDEKQYTYSQLDLIRKNNFKNNEVVLAQLKNNAKVFGKDNNNIIKFIKEIVDKTETIIREYKNPFGGHIKFGLSSPHYIMDSTDFPASFDGRKAKQPFSVHISADDGIPYTELLNFAANLDYSGYKFNGNVVDFMVSPSFVRNNIENFTLLLKTSMMLGVYQLQANVIDSETLIRAKSNPEEYKNLIVRVWGFNAYFRELPEEYQDYLIERAIKSECAA